MISCKGMCSLSVLRDRGGAFVLEAFMTTLQVEGEPFDLQCTRTTELPDKTVEFREHRFDYRPRKVISFSQVMIRSAEPWMASIKFYTNQRIPKRSRSLFEKIVSNGGYTTLFQADGSDFCLGPFFSRNSVLRNSLNAYLESVEDEDVSPFEVGKALWSIISCNGGLRALFEIWDDLFEAVIRYEMRLADPCSLDWRRK